jgi:hypothetical protein
VLRSLCFALALACDPQIPGIDGGDAGRDAGADGGRTIDAGMQDGGRDAGPPDDGGVDAGPFDAGPRPETPTFVDVAASAGLTEPHTRPDTCILDISRNCEIDTFTGGAAVGDIDGDGLVDLYLTRLVGRDTLYRNAGGRFEDITEAAGLGAFERHTNGAAFVDVENDGDLDLYVTAIGRADDPLNARYFLFINDGAGHFTEAAVERGAALDEPQNHSGGSIGVGDYDRDGYADLYVTEWLPRATTRPFDRLLHNRGAELPGHFTDVTLETRAMTYTERCWNREVPCTTYVFGASFSDLDGDGWPDLAVAADFGTSKIFWNRGDGTFEPPFRTMSIGGDENGMGSTIGDIDGDGDLDWLVTSIYDDARTCDTEPCNWRYSGNRLYRNDGARRWYDATDTYGVRDAGWGWGAAMFDHDNDGDLDVVATNGIDFPESDVDDMFASDPMRFWDNVGGTTIERATEVGLTARDQGRAVVVFDYDDDGDLDLLITVTGGLPHLYRNDGGNRMSYLRVRTVGTTSTAEGLGARVYVQVRAHGPRQMREIGSMTTYLGQSERIAHFGLGPSVDRVRAVEVRWPSGRVSLLNDVDTNRTITITEPD